MLKALTPVATMAVGFAFGHERPTGQLMAAVSLITAGVMAASYGEGRFSAVGVAVMVTSVCGEALRLNIMQLLMANKGMHPLEALMFLSPACAGEARPGGEPRRARRRACSVLGSGPLGPAVAHICMSTPVFSIMPPQVSNFKFRNANF